MKPLLLNALLLMLFFVPHIYAQSLPAATGQDSTKKFIDFRRTDPTNFPHDSLYKKPKAEVFPLSYFRSTGVWTELNPKVPRVNYLGLHFVNKDTGWAVGGSGAIIKTTNGGEDWAIAETPVTNLLLKIHSYNGQTVIATGYDGIILRSTDGGENFEQVTSGVGTGIDLWGVQMVNDTLGWICGLYNTLLKTTDGGLTWQSVTAGLSQHYWSLSFLNENFGMIACGGGNILKTIDGGTNWLQLQAGDDRTLYTIDIIDSAPGGLHVAAAGERRLETQYEGGKNVYSSDGGATWIMNDDIPTYTDANWIEFVNKDTGYTINVNKGIYKTTNRGQSWAFVGGGGDWHIDMIGNAGYAGGNGLNIYKRTEGLENWSKIILNDNFNDVHFINETTGFALSEYLYKTVNSGINWTRIDNALGGNDIIFLDSLVGFIGGSQALQKTTDGGNSWYNVSGIPGGVGKIFFINSFIGWATSGRNIIKTTDVGENWFAQITLPADNFTSLYFIDSLNCLATSRYIWQTTDGGLICIQRSDIPINFTNDVYFTNIDTGWIARQSSINPSLFITTNRGLNWFAQPEILGAMKFHLFPDKNHWIITGAVVQSTIVYKKYITYNAGNNWIDISTDFSSGFGALSSVNNFLAYATGGTGLIVKYNDTVYVPVELISFEGKLEGNKIVLFWTTSTELNNKGFYIEKSSNKINWETIQFVHGKGTTTEINYYNFIDSKPLNGESYYRLKQVDYNGNFHYTKIIKVNSELNISSFQLFQNHPNPFNSTTKIKYSIPQRNNRPLGVEKSSLVMLKVYDILGNEITTLVNEVQVPGEYEIEFSAFNLSSGVYFYKLTTGGYKNVKKMILLQ